MNACTTSKPTCRLRWVSKSMLQAADLKLQQAWETTYYEGSRPVRLETEWRDVPIEQS
ncbi:hypothetical protein ABIB94_007109 [Bradyrhizobium sp. JR7.2]